MNTPAHGRSLPRVSVITPSLNQGQFIERTILSVLCQDYPNLEYIVLDGCSTDDTPQVLRRWGEFIDVLIVEKDDGQTQALNKGFRLATGDILAYLNSDDCYADPGVISRVVERFRAHPDVDVVYGQREYISPDGYYVDRFPYRPFSRNYLYLCDYITQECAFWTRHIFERAGPWLDDSYDFAMDYELWLRFLDHGAKFLSIPDWLGMFRFHCNQKSLAQWYSKGLPEIALLHEKYLGRRMTEAEMNHHIRVHMYGNDFVMRKVKKMVQYAGTLLRKVNQNFIRGVPVDEWVYQAEINPARRQAALAQSA